MKKAKNCFLGMILLKRYPKPKQRSRSRITKTWIIIDSEVRDL